MLDEPPPIEATRCCACCRYAGGDREARDGCAPACLAGVAALQVAGLRGIRAGTLDVLVPHHRQVTAPPGATFHRTRAMPDDDAARVFRPPATLPGKSVVDAARWARSDDGARLIVAASFQQRIVSLADVEQALAARPDGRRCDLVRRTAFLDVVFDPWRVAVEIDGAHHLDVRQLWDDAQRQNSVEIREALWHAGWRP